jgi:hypothetical protein
MSIRTFVACSVLVGASIATGQAEAGERQYYDTTWSYNVNYNYYYTTYYFQTVTTQTTYDYHYCIYYPTEPSYIYYYNPSTNLYWGRFVVGAKDDKQYSMLAEADRKKKKADIPETAFPEAAKMPTIPGAKDDVAMEPPPEKLTKNLPKPK